MSGFKNDTTYSTAKRATPVIAGFAALLLASTTLNAAPAIRTSDNNRVPACATPERLTAYLTDRNPGLDPRFRDIARWYQHWGDAWRVRWDYAFYQMILETNALKYRRGDGRRGDVNEKQNNFAGIGATGRGAPGDRFPDVKTGVHAQIQHLVAYSGELLVNPIAPRTQLVQDSIVEQSRRLRRPVTFGDLARRWAADRAYARSIDSVAEQFRDGYCTATAAGIAPLRDAPQPLPAARRNIAFAPPSRLGGPKPLKLAGPDALPWTDAVGSRTTAQMPPATSEPDASAPAAQFEPKSPAETHKVPPVRTIWSRDGKEMPIAAKPTRPERTSNSVPVNAPSEPLPAEASAADSNDAPALPHFKIGPQTPQPSRLGGPVDMMPAAVAATQPVVHFKDIVNSPVAAEPAGEPPGACRVLAASYGGRKTLLVRANVNGETRYTALTVLDGFEKSMFDTYTKAQAADAEIVGEYASRDDALADARTNCPG